MIERNEEGKGEDAMFVLNDKPPRPVFLKAKMRVCRSDIMRIGGCAASAAAADKQLELALQTRGEAATEKTNKRRFFEGCSGGHHFVASAATDAYRNADQRVVINA